MTKQRAGCLSVFLPFLKLLTVKEKKPQKLPYAKRDDFLSSAEMSFYKVLTQALGDEFTICPKVGLKDIFFVNARDGKRYFAYFNQISRKHVDFLVCQPGKMESVLGIELDDLSHSKEERRARDIFVNAVFAAAGLPLVRFRSSSSYAISEIKEKIGAVLKPAAESLPLDEQAETNEIARDVPLCPKCGIPMVLRRGKQGKNRGITFYGCINFPKCRETKEI